MKYLSIQTFQCGISVSGAATFTGGATINVLALNGATTSSEASLFLGAHGANEGGQLVLQKGTGQTYAAHLDNYNDQFRILYGTNTGSTGIALAVSLSNRQLILPAYTSSSSFSGTAAGYLAFDSSGNIITTAVPTSGVSSIIAGTGVTVSSGTGNVTVSIGQSVATSATPSFDQIFLTNNGNGTNVKIGDDAWIGDVNAANTLRIMGQQNNADGYIVFGNSDFTALGRSGTGNLTYGGSTVWTAATLTNLNQLTNGPGYITSAALAGYVPTSRTLTINGTSYDLSADRTWTINTVAYTSRLQHQVKAGVAINKGQAVYVTSADGTNMIVGLASNASEATSSKTMGLLDATVSTNGFANVVTEGLLAGLDTSAAGTEGDPVWLGTGGNLIYGLTNKPYAPAHLVFIGIVTRKNANNGEIFVKVQNGFELNEIHDVDLKTTAPINGHLLGYNGTLWVNKTIAGWLGYTPANASGTTNYLSKFTGSTTLGNSQIFDNGTNVAIGTSSPFVKLDVRGEAILLYRAATNAYAIYSAANNSYSWQFGVNNGSDYVIWGGGFTGLGTERFRIASTGEATFSSSVTAGGAISTSGTGLNASVRINNTTASTGVDWHLYSLNNGNFGLYNNTGGAYAFQVTSAGNVGIGTTSPVSSLSVVGKTNLGGQASGFYVTPSTLHIASSTVSQISFEDYIVTAAIALANNTFAFGHQNASPSYEFKHSNTYNGNYATTGTTFARFNPTTSYISSGNIGIGTTSPTGKLDIVPSAQNAINISRAGGYASFYSSNDLVFETDSVFYFGVYTPRLFSVNGSFYTTVAGSVGIGTSSPSQKLHVVGASILANNSSINPDTYVNTVIAGAIGTVGGWGLSSAIGGNAGTGHSWAIGTNGDNLYMGYSNGSSSNSMLTFLQVDDSTRNVFLVPQSGNVGIGNASPSYKLDVSGALRATGTVYSDNGSLAGALNLGQVVSIGSSFGSYANLIFTMHNGGGFSDIMKLQGNGNVGIGTNSPSGRVHIKSSGLNTYPLLIQRAANTNNIFYVVETSGGDGQVVIENSGGGAAVQLHSNGTSYFNGGNVGIGTTTPSTLLDVSGVITATGGNSTNWNTAYGWGNHSSAGYVPQARTLTINGTSYDLSANRSWTISAATPGGSDTQFQYNSSGSLAGASALTYNSTTNRVGINQASPGYDLDVNGQVRVQDKLRVGTGNGVVHMSSTATINPSATTVVWAQTVSVGMCAFIEYYILNNNSLTDQRAGTIMVTWNQSGTPTITHTETTTPDIGSTTTVNFTSSLVGSDARINAVNSSANPYTMVMSYKYF
jgi:hypothetical protein